ncbi:hypothetical protein [Actibacterium sp. XHP0104]|uniref:hypothetical protein n=1 Tax=Actibacterium sp. XHP0104 TaxID=2984335 RepID=UPI0021E7E5E7|nr:hypothetical protein [Actibacterium sp. XHP0104]MCV2881418.1 hypothetical protein [Actibacterium sp. XHP0104]
MKHHALILCLGLTAACALPQTGDAPQPYHANNELWVTPAADDANSFVVRSVPGAGNHHIWCAATDYVRHELRLPPETRIYLSEPVGPAANQPRTRVVGFTVAPDADLLAEAAALPDSLFLTLKKRGANLSAFFFGPDCHSVMRFE